VSGGRPGRRTVAVVAPYYPPRIGGVERYAERVAAELRDQPDLRPVVITTGPGRRTRVEVRDGVDVVRLPVWLTLSNTPVHPLWFWTVRRILRRYEVEIVNTHAPVPGLADVATLVAGSRPVVSTYHAGSMVKHDGRLDGLLRAYERHVLPRLFARAAAVVAVSRTSLAHAVPGSQVIPPGVDTGAFTPSTQEWGRTLLYVGRLDRSSAWKGVDVLLRAFALVAADDPQARLHVVGSGDALDDHRALAAALGVADRTRFSGHVEGADLVAAYQHARALVLPSLTEAESFGMTLIEAMACARPVIASRVGGIPDVVQDGVQGLLVAPGDAAALAAACRTLLADDALCAALGARGRLRAEQAYAWPAQTAAYLDLFRGLLRPAPSLAD
jgi:glycosyltransferase involved in cell wall biosynthesis